jgi:site-specific recombinase
MSDMHFYDPQLDPNLQGECAICGGRPDDPVHRGARIDALRVIAAREAELLAEVERLKHERDEARSDLRALQTEIVGDTGLSAMLVATQAKLFRPRAERAEAEAAQLRALLDEARASGQKKHRRAQEAEAGISIAEWQLEMFDCYRLEAWLSDARATLAKIGGQNVD